MPAYSASISIGVNFILIGEYCIISVTNSEADDAYTSWKLNTVL